VFLALAHERRRIVHFAVTAHPNAEWTAHQLREAFPWETVPQYRLPDRDRIFGHDFVEQVKAMGTQEILSAPRSPWQRAYIERVIGTIRRECLDQSCRRNAVDVAFLVPINGYCAQLSVFLRADAIVVTSGGGLKLTGVYGVTRESRDVAQ
jgi:hypothetical protein